MHTDPRYPATDLASEQVHLRVLRAVRNASVAACSVPPAPMHEAVRRHGGPGAARLAGALRRGPYDAGVAVTLAGTARSVNVPICGAESGRKLHTAVAAATRALDDSTGGMVPLP